MHEYIGGNQIRDKVKLIYITFIIIIILATSGCFDSDDNDTEKKGPTIVGVYFEKPLTYDQYVIILSNFTDIKFHFENIGYNVSLHSDSIYGETLSIGEPGFGVTIMNTTVDAAKLNKYNKTTDYMITAHYEVPKRYDDNIEFEKQEILFVVEKIDEICNLKLDFSDAYWSAVHGGGS